jgi:hypothetical protein
LQSEYVTTTPRVRPLSLGMAPRLSRWALAVQRLTWGTPSLPGVAAALLFALAARLPHFAVSDFPLNDGGLFYVMAREVRAAGYALPAFSAYNVEAIPFAYPPLAFYLVAILSRLTNLEPLALVRYLPLLANLATVGLVCVLARSLLGRGWAALVAPVVFALVPRSYEWMIMGGGLTRSTGLLFAVGCLSLAQGLFAAPTLSRAAVCAVLAALALAAHLEQGVFVFSSLALMALCYGRGPRAPLVLGLLGVAMLGLTAPWWGLVVARHGLAPFDAASLTGGWTSLGEQLAALQRFLFPPSLFLAGVGALAVLGAITCLVRGHVFLPAWLAAIFVFIPRSAASEGTLPLALLAGVGLAHVVAPGLLRAARRGDLAWLWTSAALHARRLTPSPLAPPLLSLVGLVPVVAVFAYWPGVHVTRDSLDSLSAADRQAMAWVAQHTPESSAFLVLTGTRSWEEDRVGEWFPALAARRSVLTPQGAEWLPDQEHRRRVCLFTKVRDILGAQRKGVDDLDAWAGGRGVAFSHVYVSRAAGGSIDWSPLIASASASPNYSVLVNNASVAVLQRSVPVQPRWDGSGELVVSRDCQSLADQSAESQRAFEAAHGPLAARAWVEAHEQAIGRRVSLCTRVSGLAPLAALCG